MSIDASVKSLEASIMQGKTIQDFQAIFAREVQVTINPLWGSDSVKVNGYEGAVSTDLIASAIWPHFHHRDPSQEKEALALANLLEAKVVIPRRNKLIQLDKSGCCSALIYKVRHCARIFWTP